MNLHLLFFNQLAIGMQLFFEISKIKRSERWWVHDW